MNDVVRWILSLLITAVVGSYAFTYRESVRIEDKISVRLDRLEGKIDQIIKGSR